MTKLFSNVWLLLLLACSASSVHAEESEKPEEIGLWTSCAVGALSGAVAGWNPGLSVSTGAKTTVAVTAGIGNHAFFKSYKNDFAFLGCGLASGMLIGALSYKGELNEQPKPAELDGQPKLTELDLQATILGLNTSAKMTFEEILQNGVNKEKSTLLTKHLTDLQATVSVYKKSYPASDVTTFYGQRRVLCDPLHVQTILRIVKDKTSIEAAQQVSASQEYKLCQTWLWW